MEIEIRDNRQKEWFWLDNEYLNGYARLLGASCTVVYLSLCRHVDNSTQKCYPSMKLIAEENGIGERTVIRAIKTLEEWNIIRVYRSKNNKGTQNNNVYVLTAKSVWKKKPSDNMAHGEPTAKSDKNRLPQSHKNNTHINNKILFRIKNTNTGEVSSRDFKSEQDAKDFMKSKASEWCEFITDLKIVKISK